MLTIRKGFGPPRHLRTIKLTDAAGEPVADLVSKAYVGLERSFVIDGREYLWKRTCNYFSLRLR